MNLLPNSCQQMGKKSENGKNAPRQKFLSLLRYQLLIDVNEMRVKIITVTVSVRVSAMVWMAIVPVAGSIASWLFLRWPDQYHLPLQKLPTTSRTPFTFPTWKSLTLRQMIQCWQIRWARSTTGRGSILLAARKHVCVRCIVLPRGGTESLGKTHS